MVISNLGDSPYELILAGEWCDRQSDISARCFIVPIKEILFLEKTK